VDDTAVGAVGAGRAVERFHPYRRMIRAQLRAQMSYRLSFWLETVGSTFYTGLDLLAVVVLMSVAHTIGDFDFAEVFAMSTLASLAFASADLLIGQIDAIRIHIRAGRLDSLLVRPLGLLTQLATEDLQLRRVGRCLLAAVTLGVALGLAHVHWTPARVLMVPVAVVSGTVFFMGLFVTGSTLAFWWIDSGEFANGFTYGGRDFTTYPMTVYGALFRRLFAYGLGFAFVAYYPGLVLLDHPDPLGLPPWTGWLAPAVAAAAATVAATMWRIGIRHYRSTGS
jgi:ABC-2 type transport system permease protein